MGEANRDAAGGSNLAGSRRLARAAFARIARKCLACHRRYDFVAPRPRRFPLDAIVAGPHLIVVMDGGVSGRRGRDQRRLIGVSTRAVHSADAYRIRTGDLLRD
jgi:hypothetical protein